VNLYRNPLLKGDLRLSSVYTMSSDPSASKYNENLSTERSYIFKWLNGSGSTPREDVRQAYVPYLRIPILYLHMAEALNGAGFPETAYAVLRYGLAYETMADRSIISQDEFDDLCKIKSVCPRIAAQEEEKYRDDAELNDQTKGSFVIWSSNVFARPDKRTPEHSASISVPQGLKPQIGIHSFGSGDTEYDDKYYWLDDPNDAQMKADLEAIKAKSPIAGTITDVEIYETDDDSEAAEEGSEDIDEIGQIYAKVTYVTEEGVTVEEEFTEEAYNQLVEAYEAVNAAIRNYYRNDARAKRQARVAQLILEEEALEGMFEGHRFYDLMRYQMRNGSLGATITMPAYITKQYGETSRMAGRPWFLQLPKR
ncbi:MAG: RagB/SusD family nutrient uptake outer membrane protein, partial [Bacteroidaceae bacterium]|nr:RagB/SusD family nutrient uptake outer membrane protein [Bacteroidaceae bacterium]